MNYTYTVSGMTCGNCRAQVENKLAVLDGVHAVTVDLERAEAVIEAEKPLDVSKLQAALPDKYKISEKKEAKNVFTSTTVAKEEKSNLQQLRPLFLILGYIAAASVLINYETRDWGAAMLDFMGLFFIVFSFFKLLDLKGFPASFQMYDPLAKILPAYAWAYPFIETALGLMFLMRFQVGVALVVTVILLGITTVGVTKTLLDKKSIQCACLGTALKLPMTEATFIENAIMLVMAIWMLAVGF